MALAVSTGRPLLSSVVFVASADVNVEDAVTSVSSPKLVRIAPARPRSL